MRCGISTGAFCGRPGGSAVPAGVGDAVVTAVVAVVAVAAFDGNGKGVVGAAPVAGAAAPTGAPAIGRGTKPNCGPVSWRGIGAVCCEPGLRWAGPPRWKAAFCAMKACSAGAVAVFWEIGGADRYSGRKGCGGPAWMSCGWAAAGIGSAVEAGTSEPVAATEAGTMWAGAAASEPVA